MGARQISAKPLAVRNGHKCIMREAVTYTRMWAPQASEENPPGRGQPCHNGLLGVRFRVKLPCRKKGGQTCLSKGLTQTIAAMAPMLSCCPKHQALRTKQRHLDAPHDSACEQAGRPHWDKRQVAVLRGTH